MKEIAEHVQEPSERLTNSGEAAKACVYAILGWFNNEDPFWSSFVPEPQSTQLCDGRFAIVLRGDGVRLDIRGIILADTDAPGLLRPSIVVGTRLKDDEPAPQVWYPVTCSLGPHDRFVTSNFRHAVEASIAGAKRNA